MYKIVQYFVGWPAREIPMIDNELPIKWKIEKYNFLQGFHW